MIIGKQSFSADKPQELWINKLYNNIYEIGYNENITKEQKTIGEKEDEIIEEYKYDSYTNTVKLNTYDETVAALIALKYTFADEISMLKKIQGEKDSEETTVYEMFVERCKQYAREYWRVN